MSQACFGEARFVIGNKILMLGKIKKDILQGGTIFSLISCHELADVDLL